MVGKKILVNNHPMIDIVSFPDRAAFDDYRKDSRLADWMEVRARAIAKTVIVFGADPVA